MKKISKKWPNLLKNIIRNNRIIATWIKAILYPISLLKEQVPLKKIDPLFSKTILSNNNNHNHNSIVNYSMVVLIEALSKTNLLFRRRINLMKTVYWLKTVILWCLLQIEWIEINRNKYNSLSPDRVLLCNSMILKIITKVH